MPQLKSNILFSHECDGLDCPISVGEDGQVYIRTTFNKEKCSECVMAELGVEI